MSESPEHRQAGGGSPPQRALHTQWGMQGPPHCPGMVPRAGWSTGPFPAMEELPGGKYLPAPTSASPKHGGQMDRTGRAGAAGSREPN